MHLCIGVWGNYGYASGAGKDTLLFYGHRAIWIFFPSHGENEAIILKAAKMKGIRIYPENIKVQYTRNAVMPTVFPSIL